jgi:hypothetical protein
MAQEQGPKFKTMAEAMKAVDWPQHPGEKASLEQVRAWKRTCEMRKLRAEADHLRSLGLESEAKKRDRWIQDYELDQDPPFESSSPSKSS